VVPVSCIARVPYYDSRPDGEPRLKVHMISMIHEKGVCSRETFGWNQFRKFVVEFPPFASSVHFVVVMKTKQLLKCSIIGINKEYRTGGLHIFLV